MAIETGGEKRGRGRPRKNAGADEGGAARSETPQASAELEFSDHLKSNTEYRRRNKKDVYKWDGERWNGVSTDDGERDAVEWLAANRPESCSLRKGESAWATGAIRLPPLRLISEDAKTGKARYIVPTRNLWLEIEIDRDSLGRAVGGKIRKVAPDIEVGVTGDIPVRVEGVAGDEYVPTPLPDGSLFAKFLASSFPMNGAAENVEALEAIQEYAGYTIIPGSPNEQVAHLWYGKGGNGKGVLKALLSKFHGKAASVDLERLDGFGLQPLQDATLAMVDEMPKNFSPERLKSLVSGDPMFLDRKYKDPISDFRSGARWILNSNVDFGIRSVDSSPGFFRRFIFIEWGATPTIEDRVAGLEDAIFEKEPNAVLDWLLIGLLRYLSNGRLFVPAASLRMKESAMAAADSVLSWADDVGGKVALAPTDAARSSRSKIYAHYCEYCAQAGRLSVSDVVFWTRLKGKWGDDLNTLVSESRKGGVYQKLTNIDLSKDSTAAEAALDKGQVDCSRKRASLIDLYGLVARLPAPIEHIAQPPAICLPPEMDGFALLGEEPWGIVSEPPRRRTGSGVGAPFPVAVWGQARGPISDLVAPS